MSKTIIYLKSSDIALRHTIDEIMNLEKGLYNINDLLGLKKVIDVLEEKILAEGEAIDHNDLVAALQALIDNLTLEPTEEQAPFVDQEYELSISEYINTLSEEIMGMDAPFTSIQYDKMVTVEKKLTKDIDKIIEKNDNLVQQINSLKESINTSENNTPELAEKAESIKNSDKLNLKSNNKLVNVYEGKIKGALGSENIVESIINISNKWSKQYNINYGTYGNDLADLIRLTNKINDLYSQFVDTSDYEALNLYATTIADAIEASPITVGENSYDTFNEVPVENRRQVLENAIDSAAENQENEAVSDKLRGLKLRLGNFSQDNYQFSDEDKNALRNLAASANNEISNMEATNADIQSQIDEKTAELEQNIAAYTEKHNEEPQIDPVDDNQEPKENKEGIDEIIEEINNIIDNELPYISGFNINIENDSPMVKDESRTITITDIEPDYHKEAEFVIESITTETFEYAINDNEITITALGTGNIEFKVVTGENENRVERQVNFDVTPNEIEDFEVQFDDSSMNQNDERTITIGNISPDYHVDQEFSYTVENGDSIEEISFDNTTGELTFKATGLDNINITLTCGNISKEINIPVNKIVTSFELTSDIENNTLELGENIVFNVANIEPQDHREISAKDITISGIDNYEIANNEGIFTITYTPNEIAEYNILVAIDGIEQNIVFTVNMAQNYVWYVGKQNRTVLGETVTSTPDPLPDDPNNVIFHYTYSFDPDNLPKVGSIDDIYTSTDQNDPNYFRNIDFEEDEPATGSQIFIVCPTEWIGQFELQDNNNNVCNMSIFNLNDEMYTFDYKEKLEELGLSILMQSAPCTDHSIRIVRKI